MCRDRVRNLVPAMRTAPGLLPLATLISLMGTARTAAGGPRLSELWRAAAAATACTRPQRANTAAVAGGQAQWALCVVAVSVDETLGGTREWCRRSGCLTVAVVLQLWLNRLRQTHVRA